MGRIPTKRGLAMLITFFVLNITEQIGHTLAFSKEAVDLSDAVTIRITDRELVQVLNQLLTPRQIGSEIRDNFRSTDCCGG